MMAVLVKPHCICWFYSTIFWLRAVPPSAPPPPPPNSVLIHVIREVSFGDGASHAFMVLAVKNLCLF